MTIGIPLCLYEQIYLFLRFDASNFKAFLRNILRGPCNFTIYHSIKLTSNQKDTNNTHRDKKQRQRIETKNLLKKSIYFKRYIK